MGEFFRGWRRNTGLLTLVLACLFMAGWVRSLSIQDQLMVQQQQSLHFVMSMDGTFGWARSSPYFLNMPIRWVSKDSTKMIRRNFWEDGDVHWNWQWCGFDFGAASIEVLRSKGGTGKWTQTELWQVPYWSIVFPLTLLSLWLLLSKPRPSTSNKTLEPIPIEGT